MPLSVLFKTTEEKEQEDKKLPELSEGQTFDGVQTKISEHYTTPPKHFTEDSLFSAMERAGSEDMGDDVERKGLGTPATRADIIEKLVKDGFVKREKKADDPHRGRNEADYGASRCGEVPKTYR